MIDGWWYMKKEDIIKVITFDPEGKVNVWDKFHGSPSNRDISLNFTKQQMLTS